MTQRETVFVGLSGGVDSSVAALRLQQTGYDVVGVFIKVWHPDWLQCNWELERLDAMRVAARLKIPFLTCDAESAYKDDVAEYFISEYKAGRTPNPDVMCNKYVKFGRFLEFAMAHGADRIATGHYAQVLTHSDQPALYRGLDTNKDQSYFLWTLTPAQLERVLFPVGNTPKSDIRNEAERAGLLTAEKPDSQGICFLGHIDIPEFLAHYTHLVPGDVLDDTGAIIGSHIGALVYTTGQRHGFTITPTATETLPHYVVDRDLHANTITVSTSRPHAPKNESITLGSVNLIAPDLKEGTDVSIQTRYRQPPTAAVINAIDSDTVTLSRREASEPASPGQSCVLYEGDRCLGGGIIR